MKRKSEDNEVISEPDRKRLRKKIRQDTLNPAGAGDRPGGLVGKGCNLFSFLDLDVECLEAQSEDQAQVQARVEVGDPQVPAGSG